MAAKGKHFHREAKREKEERKADDEEEQQMFQLDLKRQAFHLFRFSRVINSSFALILLCMILYLRLFTLRVGRAPGKCAIYRARKTINSMKCENL